MADGARPDGVLKRLLTEHDVAHRRDVRAAGLDALREDALTRPHSPHDVWTDARDERAVSSESLVHERLGGLRARRDEPQGNPRAEAIAAIVVPLAALLFWSLLALQ